MAEAIQFEKAPQGKPDPAIEACAEFARVWHACVLSDEDPDEHASWDAEMAAAEETLVEIVPTTIEGAAALLGVVRLRMRGSMGDEFDHALISNVETGLRSVSAA